MNQTNQLVNHNIVNFDLQQKKIFEKKYKTVYLTTFIDIWENESVF